jgi:hypothetical protein
MSTVTAFAGSTLHRGSTLGSSQVRFSMYTYSTYTHISGCQPLGRGLLEGGMGGGGGGFFGIRGDYSKWCTKYTSCIVNMSCIFTTGFKSFVLVN